MIKINFRNGTYIEMSNSKFKTIRGNRAFLNPFLFDYEKADPNEVKEIMENIDIKALEKQKAKLDVQIKEYYQKKEEERIRKNEEKYVGKCYKIVGDKEVVYFKVLSGLTSNTYCYMHNMKFMLPVNPRFRHMLRKGIYQPYEYYFDGDLLEFDEFSINNVFPKKENLIEISVDEFEAALREYGKQLIEVSRDDFTMNGKYYKER